MARQQQHHYAVTVEWVGNTGQGTVDYKSYDRTHRIAAEEKPDILGSADPAFRGDGAYWNPEDLLVAALSACHKLWYLHFCADAGITVTAYRDEATGLMEEDGDGGQFVHVLLRPQVTITKEADADRAERLHATASRRCFIRNSVNFTVDHEPKIIVERAQARNTTRSRSPEGSWGDR
ncbi:MAG: OsmC family protein [Gammaproteobacteria bacterium]|nr:OsmC family protein [Gammaproteobacteria bacterium]